MMAPCSSMRAWAACLFMAATPIGPLAASTAVLRVDGILRVKGMPLSGARLIILEQDGAMEVMERGLERFERELPLHTAVLFTFERNGCVTKQLYFDTHVPGEDMGFAPFSFPFKVTLEPPPDGQRFEYAGPVGYIRYYPERHDFGYDTDYKRLADPVLAERMRGVMTRLGAPVPLASPNAVSVADVAGTANEAWETNAFNELVPTMATRETLVHPTGTMERTVPAAIEGPPEGPALPVIVPFLASGASPVGPPSMAPEDTGDGTAASGMRDLSSPAVPLVERSEELIVEKRWVIKIVRLTSNGTTEEYRRVQHHFGAVYYFRNGGTCSEWVYEHGIASAGPQPW